MDVWEKVKIHMEMDVFESMVLFDGNLLGFLRSSTILPLSKMPSLLLATRYEEVTWAAAPTKTIQKIYLLIYGFVVSWECKGPNPPKMPPHN